MVQIIPTTFSTTEEEYKQRLAKLASSQLFKKGWVQLDLMDNKFVPNLSIGLDIIKKNPPPYKMEAQLMVVDPAEWFDELFELKVNRIIFPIEIDKDLVELINLVKKKNIEVGLSVNPDTDVERLNPYLNLLDAVLFMAVNPGAENQTFDTRVYEKIRFVKQQRPEIIVGVDGGVNDTNIKDLVATGLDYVAIGSFLFKGDFDENLERIWRAING